MIYLLLVIMLILMVFLPVYLGLILFSLIKELFIRGTENDRRR